MNKKEKEIIGLKNELKKMEDIKDDLEKAVHEKERLEDKFKIMKKEKQVL